MRIGRVGGRVLDGGKEVNRVVFRRVLLYTLCACIGLLFFSYLRYVVTLISCSLPRHAAIFLQEGSSIQSMSCRQIGKAQIHISRYASGDKNQDETHGTDVPVDISQRTYGCPQMQAESIAAAAKTGAG